MVHDEIASLFARASSGALAETDFTASAGVSGELTTVLDLSASTIIGLMQGRRMLLSVPAFESFTADGSNGAETFNLNNDLIDSDHVSDSVDIFLDDNGNSVTNPAPNSVDYGANSVTVDTPSSVDDVFVFYTAADQAHAQLVKTSPSNTRGATQQIDAFDPSLLHRRDPDKTPVELSFTTPLEGVIPEDFALELRVDAPYVTKFAHDASTRTVRPTNGALSLPRKRVNADVPGLKDAVKREMI